MNRVICFFGRLFPRLGLPVACVVEEGVSITLDREGWATIKQIGGNSTDVMPLTMVSEDLAARLMKQAGWIGDKNG